MKKRTNKAKPAIPRSLSLVKFDFDKVPVAYHAKYPFVIGDSYVFFGEIPNMPGHCVVAHHGTGQIFSGYHTENFVELSDEDGTGIPRQTAH